MVSGLVRIACGDRCKHLHKLGVLRHLIRQASNISLCGSEVNVVSTTVYNWHNFNWSVKKLLRKFTTVAAVAFARSQINCLFRFVFRLPSDNFSDDYFLQGFISFRMIFKCDRARDQPNNDGSYCGYYCYAHALLVGHLLVRVC